MKQIYLFLIIGGLCFLGGNDLLAQFSGGTGTSADPYQISTAADLNNVRNYLTKYFRQDANIDLDVSPYNTGAGWNPIGDDAAGSRFTGNYDGNGKTISGLTINRPAEGEVGLFGCLGLGTSTDPAVIKKVVLVIVGSVSGARGTGSLVGRVRGNVYTLIENCSASGGTVSGNGATGGLVGANNSATVTPGGTNNPTLSQSWANIDVTGVTGGVGDKIGGLVGCNQKGNTINCYALGSVTIPASGTFTRIGGLAGCTDLRGTITTSFSTGSVSVNENPSATLVGGLVGHIGTGGNKGVVTNAFWNTTTSGQSSSAAGTGLTTAQMKVEANFTGFDFTNIWTIDETTNDGYPFLRNTAVTTYNNWTGAINTTWDNTGNWSAGRLPISTDIAVIPSGLAKYPIIISTEDFTATAKILDILQGGSLTINALGKFKVIGDLRSEKTGLIIKSDASGTGSLLHDAMNVNATIERYVTGNTTLTAMSYHTVSVPLTQDANPLSGLFLGSYLYEFDAVNQEWDPLGTPTNTPLNADKGYLLYYPASNKTYSFEGPMNNGAFSAASMSTDVGDHQLIPNPYPSAIDWDANDGWAKTNFYNAVWVWNASTAGWASYIGTTGVNDGSNIIPVGQSFMVQSSVASPSLTMNNQVRVHDDQDFLKSNGDDFNVMRIKALTENYSDEIVLKYHDQSSYNFDGDWDAGKLYGFGDAPQLYSYSNDGYKLSINTMPILSEDMTVQIGFELSTSETVTLSFSSLENFHPESTIILTDELTGANIDVRSNPDYTFFSTPDDDPNRFKILLKNKTSISERNYDELNAYFSGQTLYFSFDNAVGSTLIQLYTTSGQLVHSSTVDAGQNSLQIQGLAKGIYVLKLINKDAAYSAKVSYR